MSKINGKEPEPEVLEALRFDGVDGYQFDGFDGYHSPSNTVKEPSKQQSKPSKKRD